MQATTILKPSQLRLRDVVRLISQDGSVGPWTTSTVTETRDGRITLTRPYGTTTDFEYGGKVIHYTGLETIVIDPSDTRLEYELLERPPAPR
jgi:hypothetical protein